MNLDWSVHEIAVFWGEISNYLLIIVDPGNRMGNAGLSFSSLMLEKDCEWALRVDLALPRLEMRCPPYVTQDWTVDLWEDIHRVS